MLPGTLWLTDPKFAAVAQHVHAIDGDATIQPSSGHTIHVNNSGTKACSLGSDTTFPLLEEQ